MGTIPVYIPRMSKFGIAPSELPFTVRACVGVVVWWWCGGGGVSRWDGGAAGLCAACWACSGTWLLRPAAPRSPCCARSCTYRLPSPAGCPTRPSPRLTYPPTHPQGVQDAFTDWLPKLRDGVLVRAAGRAGRAGQRTGGCLGLGWCRRGRSRPHPVSCRRDTDTLPSTPACLPPRRALRCLQVATAIDEPVQRYVAADAGCAYKLVGEFAPFE